VSANAISCASGSVPGRFSPIPVLVKEQNPTVPEGSRMSLEGRGGARLGDTAGVRLRPATDADDAFCLELNEASLREYIEPIYGWDMEVQRMYHARWFDPARLTIIEDDGGDAIGVLDVTDEGDHLYLSRIEILPEVQGGGVGTAVMRDLMRGGRAIRLHVFANNVRARRFYERLGFSIDRYAEREHHVSMHHPGMTGR
jgi:ribosomal protein S18 acetylase RimI-like enzyme